MHAKYHMSGTFGGDFNLVVILIWRFGGFLAPTAKVKSLPILLFYLKS